MHLLLLLLEVWVGLVLNLGGIVLVTKVVFVVVVVMVVVWWN